MVKKSIIWTKRAKNEKRLILQFWVNNNKNNIYASQLNFDFTKQADLIGKYNDIGKPTDFGDIKVCFINHFSMFYLIKTHQIVIVGIWDNRRNPTFHDFR